MEEGVRRQIIDTKTSPGSRPLQGLTQADIADRLERALAKADGAMGAHCVHELWMRGEMSINIERALERLWAQAAASVPEWLPIEARHRSADRADAAFAIYQALGGFSYRGGPGARSRFGRVVGQGRPLI
jgi:hypothetical protein